MAAVEESTRTSSNGVVSKGSWISASVHQITLPSGARVKVQMPDLSRLIRSDLLPEDLRAAALRRAFDDLEVAPPLDPNVGNDPEKMQKALEERFAMAKQLVQFLDFLLTEMMVEPKLSMEEVAKIPGEDRDMLIAIAQRERNTDARGVRLGVAPLNAFHEFRELHGCVDREPEGCPSCQTLQQLFSSADLGRV